MFLRRKVPALAACLLAAVLIAAFAISPHGFYRDANLLWGNKAYWYPFLDTDTVLSAVRCLRADVDAYVFNPCDPQLRVFTYSPLWMYLTAFPMTEAWVPWVGLSWVMLFLASLFLLPAARGREAQVIMVLSTASSASVYAMERGNNDLVIFALVSLAAVLTIRNVALRRLGYAFALLAGLLKYYPLVTMAIALRERPGRFFAITLASIAVTALAVLVTWDDLVRVLRSIPIGQFYTDMFGSKSVGLTMVELFGAPRWTDPLVRAVLSLVAIGVGLRIGLGHALHSDLARLSPRERSFLLVGALMCCSCYFSAQNIGYRAINLILVMPAITALLALTGRPVYRWIAAAAVALLWTGAWRYLWEDGVMAGTGQFDVSRYAALFLRDALWWGVIAFLLATIVALLRDSPLPAAVLGWFRKASPVI
ncbi:glycosyltransferase 87 family protein [Novosphingobium sp. MW5]|nr:glycosyltransferase 87 family protein [Novosphingobium sp. MW5]